MRLCFWCLLMTFVASAAAAALAHLLQYASNNEQLQKSARGKFRSIRITNLTGMCLTDINHTNIIAVQGKFVRIHFGTSGKIAGADIESCESYFFLYY